LSPAPARFLERELRVRIHAGVEQRVISQFGGRRPGRCDCPPRIVTAM
jgi:hypothetical protein